MKKLVCVAVGLTFLVALALSTSPSGAAQDKDKDKPIPIKEVMKKAHKGDLPLFKKIQEGTASKAEKEELVTLYVALSQNKPPAGDEKSWKEKTDALVAAAKACAKDDKDGPDKLKKALNCKACHDAHKGK